ncbi:MAG TPA: hypothetical protein VHC47_05760, partial [Mucilaginibacter sp.]|nr:hypothetical protein [Mucilaginibacter sp.]
QKIPFGYLSDFTDDRLALACTPEGGKLMHTPKYTTEDNLEKRSADFTITDTGDLEGSMRTAFSGADYDDRYRIIQDAPADRVKDIRKYYPINNMNISSLEYKQDKSAQPKTFENIKLTAQEYGALDNDKFYFSLNSVDRVDAVPPRVFNRLNPVSITRGYTDEDEITYTLPKGYKLGSEPLHINIDKPYGSYSVSMLLNGDQLIYRRKFQIKDGTYSKDLYDGLVDFFQAVSDADNYNVMLVKK